MSYSQVSHIGHDSYPPFGPGPGPGGMLGSASAAGPGPPPPPPRPGFEEGYGGGGPPVAVSHYSHPQMRYQYQEYLRPQTQFHPFSSYDYPTYDNNPCSSFLRACVAALCCCCMMEECCPRW